MPTAMMDSTTLIKRAVIEHRDWIKRVGETIKQENEADIRGDLNNFDYRTVKVLPLALRRLALYHSAHGTIDVIDGKGGWESIDRAVMHCYWWAKLEAAVALMQTRPDYPDRYHSIKALWFGMPIAASLLCYAVVHELRDLRDDLWAMWRTVLSTPTAVNPSYWGPVGEGKYELFVFRLMAASPIGQDTQLPAAHQDYDLGPYARVLGTWEEPDALALSLGQICDYHCQNLDHFRGDRDPWPPFCDPPFDLVPYEILAIYKLRAEQGLETPEIDHPLMKLPTASLAPRKVHPIDDPVFAEIEALFDKHCQPFWNDLLGR